MRFSSRRQLIIDTLRECTNHPTAEELYELVRVEMPSISLGTVYRNLGFLVERGDIRKFESPGEVKARYDARKDEHSHLVCRLCNSVFDVKLHSLRSFDSEVARDTGFRIEHHDITLQGVCRECQEKLTR